MAVRGEAELLQFKKKNEELDRKNMEKREREKKKREPSK